MVIICVCVFTDRWMDGQTYFSYAMAHKCLWGGADGQTDTQTDTHWQTDGTENITSSTDAGGKNVLSSLCDDVVDCTTSKQYLFMIIFALIGMELYWVPPAMLLCDVWCVSYTQFSILLWMFLTPLKFDWTMIRAFCHDWPTGQGVFLACRLPGQISPNLLAKGYGKLKAR